MRFVIYTGTRSTNCCSLGMVTGSIIYVLQWGDMQAFIYKCGVMFDAICMYWLFRQAIRSWDDIIQIIYYFALFAIVSAPLIIAEKIRQSSFYEIFGPVGAKFHRGRFRCAGPFPHYIMMGAFWANLLPLYFGAIKAGSNKLVYAGGIIGATLCTIYSASSTAFITIAAIIMFWSLYPWRKYGKHILFGVLCLLFMLHMIMKAPVWHLMARVDIFSGSTGWHRFHLFDMFVKHASEWLALGTRSTESWGEGLHDVTNQFVLEGVQGGLATLIIFITLIIFAVSIPGKTSLSIVHSKNHWLSWALCVAMLGHSVTFWGVSYFGQIIMLLYLNFAIVAFVQDQRRLVIQPANKSTSTGRQGCHKYIIISDRR